MASIQQAMNQGIGALTGLATGVSYLYSQSPMAQGKKLTKQAETMLKASSDEVVGDNLEEGTRAAEEAVAAARKGYMLHPNERSHEAYFKAIGNLEQYQEAKQFTEEYARQQAEEKAINRLEEKTMTARSMLEGLRERKDILSAKERGQLDTMYHRHLKKGDFD